MHNITIRQALKVWSELEACYYDQNHYGGTTAEIYLYQIAPQSPSYIAWVGSGRKEDGLFVPDHLEYEKSAGKTLYSIIKLFEEEKDCHIKIDKLNPSVLLEEGFAHRVHLTVHRKKEKQNGIQAQT